MNRPFLNWCLLAASLILLVGTTTAQAGEKLPKGAIRRFGDASFRQLGKVFGVAVVQKSGRLVIATELEIVVWDLAKGARIASAKTPYELVPNGVSLQSFQANSKDAVAVSPDGSRIAVHRQGTVFLFDGGLKPLPALKTNFARTYLQTLAFGPDASRLYGADKTGTVHIRKLNDRNWGSIGDSLGGRTFRWSAIASGICQANDKGLIRIIECENSDKITEWQGPANYAAAFSNDGKFAAFATITGMEKPKIEIWDLAKRKKSLTIGSESRFQELSLSSDGAIVATISRIPSLAQLWDTRSGDRLQSLDLAGFAPTKLFFLPGNLELVLVNESGSWILLDVKSGKPRHPDAGPFAAVKSIQFASKNRLLASDRDNQVYLCDPANNSILRWKWTKEGNRKPVLSSKGDSAFSIDAYYGKSVRLLDVETAAELRRFSVGELTNVSHLALSPQDERMAAYDYVKREILVVDPMSGKLQRTIPLGDGALLSSMRFLDPDRLLSLVAGVSQGLYLWNAASGEKLGHFNPSFVWDAGFVITPDGKRMIAIHSDFRTKNKGPTLMFWGIDTGKIVDRFELSTVQYTSIAAAQDGKLVLLGTATGDIEIWNVAQQKLHATYTGGHRGAVECLAVAPDGRTFASGGADTTVMLWKMPAS